MSLGVTHQARLGPLFGRRQFTSTKSRAEMKTSATYFVSRFGLF
jgi:hypothetical protein